MNNIERYDKVVEMKENNKTIEEIAKELNTEVIAIKSILKRKRPTRIKREGISVYQKANGKWYSNLMVGKERHNLSLKNAKTYEEAVEIEKDIREKIKNKTHRLEVNSGYRLVPIIENNIYIYIYVEDEISSNNEFYVELKELMEKYDVDSFKVIVDDKRLCVFSYYS